jgi:hypothetical protein
MVWLSWPKIDADAARLQLTVPVKVATPVLLLTDPLVNARDISRGAEHGDSEAGRRGHVAREVGGGTSHVGRAHRKEGARRRCARDVRPPVDHVSRGRLERHECPARIESPRRDVAGHDHRGCSSAMGVVRAAAPLGIEEDDLEGGVSELSFAKSPSGGGSEPLAEGFYGRRVSREPGRGCDSGSVSREARGSEGGRAVPDGALLRSLERRTEAGEIGDEVVQLVRLQPVAGSLASRSAPSSSPARRDPPFGRTGSGRHPCGLGS